MHLIVQIVHHYSVLLQCNNYNLNCLKGQSLPTAVMGTWTDLPFGTNSATGDYLFKKPTKFITRKPTKNFPEYVPQWTTELRQQKYWEGQYIFMLINGPSYYPDGEWRKTSAKLPEHTLCTGSFVKYCESTAFWPSKTLNLKKHLCKKKLALLGLQNKQSANIARFELSIFVTTSWRKDGQERTINNAQLRTV